jgi:hypothetical protein
MNKIRTILVVLLSVCLLAACGLIPTAAPSQPTAVPLATSTPLVIVVTATPAQPNVIVVTATPEQVQATATPEPATAVPTATQVPVESIQISSVTDQGGGTILVNWDAQGTSAAGFQVVWSTTNQAPVFPTDSSTYISDPNARSATFQGDANKLYFVRVCSYANNACGVYSNLGYVAVFGATAMPYVPSYVPPVRPITTGTPVSPYIYITRIKDAGAGSADIYWTAYGTFNNGFRLLISQNPNNLIYGDLHAITISHGYTRFATVSGHFYETYYFRICRYTGTTCDIYSNIYTYKFSGT